MLRYGFQFIAGEWRIPFIVSDLEVYEHVTAVPVWRYLRIGHTPKGVAWEVVCGG